MDGNSLEVRVIRSTRRTRTVQARLVAGVAEIRIPALMSKQQEQEIVAEMVAKLERKHANNAQSDSALARRAQQLNVAYLEAKATFRSIRWVSNQRKRWGSCTPSTGTIRISDRLKQVPDYVLDAVIIHELTHTFIAGHGPEFWRWADKAPSAERAKGYLEAFQRYGEGT